jgi:hypothetical protein
MFETKDNKRGILQVPGDRREGRNAKEDSVLLRMGRDEKI